ncbi:hypothetical protein [Azospirillum sp.]|uniref:hypothetical protein n=1 Tax=Azospirillum sp. TaxID=34012 RepID=UPI003D728256
MTASTPDLSPVAEVAARSTAEVAGRAASGELYALVVLVIILLAVLAGVLGVALLRRRPPPRDPPDGPCDGSAASRELTEIRDELRELGKRLDNGLRAVHGRVDHLQATLLASFASARNHHPAE